MNKTESKYAMILKIADKYIDRNTKDSNTCIGIRIDNFESTEEIELAVKDLFSNTQCKYNSAKIIKGWLIFFDC